MSDFQKLLAPPPKPYTKLTVGKGPFHNQPGCLSAREWKQLREWLDDYYGMQLQPQYAQRLSVERLHALVNDVLHVVLLDASTLKFRKKLTEGNIEDAVKTLGWSRDRDDRIVRTGHPVGKAVRS